MNDTTDRVGERGLRPHEPVAGGLGPSQGPSYDDVAPLVAQALEAQRLRTARVLAQVRLAGVGAALALGLTMTYAAAQADWRVLRRSWGPGRRARCCCFAAVRARRARRAGRAWASR